MMNVLAAGAVKEMAREMDTDGGFTHLFKAEYPSIVRTSYLIVGDQEVAREIAQEAFAKVFVSWKKVSKYDRPGAWVRRVAIRLAVRESKRSNLIGIALRKLDPPVSPSPKDPDLRAALSLLPRSQRAAIVLHYLEDLPVREVAEALGCAEATVKVHLHRARKRLAEILGEEEMSDVTG